MIPSTEGLSRNLNKALAGINKDLLQLEKGSQRATVRIYRNLAKIRKSITLIYAYINMARAELPVKKGKPNGHGTKRT